MRDRTTLVALIVLCCASTAFAGLNGGAGIGTPGDDPPQSDPPASPSDWALYPSHCPTSASLVIVECGDVGDFHLGHVVAPSGCTQTAGGSATLRGYAPAFPAGSLPFLIAPTIFAGTAGGGVTTTVASSAAPGELARATGSADPVPDGDPSSRWIGVADFNDSHGWSTTFAAGLAAGSAAEAQLVVLDDPSMAPLGPGVTDFHVLGALCRIVDSVDDGRAHPPAVVNMSFGRLLDASESEQLGADCDPDRFICQLDGVIAELREEGVTIVAAAGNHDELLFPARADDVLSVGRLDLLDAAGGSLWDSPQVADALAPGSHLCLTPSFAAPGGSSYSSALMAGWLADLRERRPEIDPHADPAWRTGWSDELSCWVVANPGHVPSACNEALQTIFAGLAGAYADSCWQGAASTTGSSTTQPAPLSRPRVPSFDHWSVEVQPTPTGDPCVPCEGEIVGEDPEETLAINTSSSQPLEPGVRLIAVYLRTKIGFDRVLIDDETRQLLRDGELDRLEIEGFDWPSRLREQPTLWYLLSDESDPDCGHGDNCYWDGSSVYVRNR